MTDRIPQRRQLLHQVDLMGHSAARSVPGFMKNVTGNVIKMTMNGHFDDVPVMFSMRTRTYRAHRMPH